MSKFIIGESILVVDINDISQNAVTQAKQTNEKVKRLAAAAQKIGKLGSALP